MKLTDFYSDDNAEPDFGEEDIEETTDDIIRRIASKDGRRYIGWPCDEAQVLPIGKVRSVHVKCCPECARLKKKLEESLLLH